MQQPIFLSSKVHIKTEASLRALFQQEKWVLSRVVGLMKYDYG